MLDNSDVTCGKNQHPEAFRLYRLESLSPVRLNLESISSQLDTNMEPETETQIVQILVH